MAIYMVLIWGSVAYLVKHEGLAIAYGIITCASNTGQTVMPVVFSNLYEKTKHEQDYASVQLAFMAVSLSCLAIKVTILTWDYKVRGGVLESQ